MKFLHWIIINNKTQSEVAAELAIAPSHLSSILHANVIPGRELIENIKMLTFDSVRITDFYLNGPDGFEQIVSDKLAAIKSSAIKSKNKQ